MDDALRGGTLYHLYCAKIIAGCVPETNSHGARPVHLISTMIKWFRTSRLSIQNSVSAGPAVERTRNT